MKPDKGNDVVILNKKDHNAKLEEILQDPTKFSPLIGDALKITMKRESAVRTFPKGLVKSKTISRL